MYKKIWFKIHLILGLTVGIILLFIGTTGAILSFEKEILKVINKDSYEVSLQKNKNKLEIKILLQKFKEKMPDVKINAITFSNIASQSVIINVLSKDKKSKRGINYFVNPYTAEILPKIRGKEFFSFNQRLHRWLVLTGEKRKIGKQIVAFSTVSLIILSISGIIIYWRRIRKGFLKSLTFNSKIRGRPFLASMHSAIGFWVLPFYLLASFTGLYWSYEWYRNGLYQITEVTKPQRIIDKEKKAKGIYIEKKISKVKSQNIKTELSFDSYQKAIEIFDNYLEKKYLSATLIIPKEETFYTFNYLDLKPEHYRANNNLKLEIISKKVLEHKKYKDKRLGEKIMESILPLHSGEYFGRIGQIGMFIASTLMILFTITGFMLYLKRTKRKIKKAII